ncbi:hypothetical protein LUZ60_017559 [Juncus effusus]|nr:hypothetical protein LUZ60_017559 [Juncus effusus]
MAAPAQYTREIDEHKRTLLLVNKADLSPFNIRKKWAECFNQHEILFAFWSAKAATASLETKTSNSESEPTLPGLDTKIYTREELLNRLQSQAKSIASSSKKQVTVGFVGYPNVGKSSTINALVGEKRTGVTTTTGKTKHFQTLIISSELILCDCPGLVFPSFSASRHEMVACGVLLVDRMTQHREAVQVVENRVGRVSLERVYNIKLPKLKTYEESNRPPNTHEVLRAYCASRGLVAFSGLPDETRSARQILKDYIDGKLPHYELPPNLNKSELFEEGESESSDEEEGKDKDVASRSVREMYEMEGFETEGLVKKKGKERKKKEAGEKAHKLHKKPQRKNDRSWQVGKDGGDGMLVVRAIQKPAVNFVNVGGAGRVV